VTDRPTAVFAMAPANLPKLFPRNQISRLQELADIDSTLIITDTAARDAAEVLAGVEILITSWGCPLLDRAALDAMPRLRAVLHAAGTVRGYVTDACWDRSLLISSAAHANAIPVAEYTLAAILLAGKDAFGLRDAVDRDRGHVTIDHAGTVGNHRRRVGVIGASHVGRHLLALMRPFDLVALLADPYVDRVAAAALGAELRELDDLLRDSDIVTLHAPSLPETHHLLDRRRLALIPDGATLINTSRGTLVDHEALTAELVSGRLNAILDVTDPEPLPTDSPLYGLPNVFLTPHIAGSMGNELERLGAAVVDEVARLADGLPLAHPVLRGDLRRVA
jgi:phosphoglycerate dehydrogenase-like enzyme